MFDAIEFVLYEILNSNERDIYRGGQNTIGFDEALSECQKMGIQIPMIGAIRQIQKQRGDAKHHGQTPEADDFQRLSATFSVIMARLIVEQFEETFGGDIKKLPLLSHEVALFECYRRQRNHDWEKAYRFILGAFLRKHRAAFRGEQRTPFDFSLGHEHQLNMVEKEVGEADYVVAPLEASETIKKVVPQIRLAVNANDWRRATDLVAQAYSTADRLVPSMFDISQAKRISSKLYQPHQFRLDRPMAWAKVWGSKGSEEAKLAEKIASFLRDNPVIVEKFGSPHYEADDDRMWRWWEFALFDGERWHTFHVDGFGYGVSLEVGPDSSTERSTSAELLALILSQLEEAAAG